MLASHKRSSSDTIPSSSDGTGFAAASHSLFRYGPCPRLNTSSGDEAAAAAAIAVDSDALSVMSTESAPLPSLPQVDSTAPAIQEDIDMPSSPPPAANDNLEAPRAEQPTQYDIELTKIMLNQSQMWFPAEAGVFVGNLPAKGYTDSDLTRLVLCHFAKIAPCFGKVERTFSTINGRVTEKPWAIIQFTTVPDAERAIASSQNLQFSNRKARVQPLNANRTI